MPSPVGYYNRGKKTHPIHARTKAGRVIIPRYASLAGASGEVRMSGPRRTRILEGGLHPQTMGASHEEKVQLVGQALTHAQKEHLQEFTGHSPEQMYRHLVGFHGFTPSPPTLRQISGFKNGIPQYEEVPNLTSKTGYVAEHLTLHHADLAERKTSRRRRS